MGKYKLSIRGKNPDYFLRKIIDKKINIYHIEKNFNKLNIIVDEDGYKKIKKIKTSYEIVVESVTGVLRIFELVNRYFFFILFFCLGIFLNIFLSTIIFKVEVVHSNNYIKEIVYNNLEKYGISKFKFKVSFEEKEKIVEKILKNEKDNLEWLEIEEIGTKYVVKVEQRKKNKDSEVCSNRNIVAKKNATILEIRADEGEVVKKKLDYVLAGDVLISGVIHNKEDIVSNKCAIGQVFGEVWYKANIELPIKYHEEKLTGKSRYLIEVKFLDKKIIPFSKYETYKKDDVIAFNNELLPIGVSFSEYFETIVKDVSYSLDNCDEVALSMAEERLKTKLGEEDAILTKKVLKKEIKKSKIIVEVFIKVKEDITDYQEIVNTEINTETD